MATQSLDPLKTALAFGELCEEIQDLEAQLVIVTAERDTYREMVLVAHNKVRELQVCIQSRVRTSLTGESFRILDTIQEALTGEDEVQS